MSDAGEYRGIRSLAVHTEDVVTALETNRTTSSRAVLRVTPPFSGRMRARLHVEGADEYENGPKPIHIDPDRLADVPPYPTPDATEERLRADPTVEYSVETHHERHTAALSAWRAAVADSVVDSVELDGEYGSHEVGVAALG